MQNLKSNQQHDALRLADELSYQVDFGSYDWKRVEPMMEKAAAELRRLNDLLGKANALCRIREERIKELESGVEVLRADAERYRWLINNAILGIGKFGVKWSLIVLNAVAPEGMRDIDAVIDAERSKT